MEQVLTIVAYGFGVLYAVVSLAAVGMWVYLTLTRGGTTTMWSLDPRGTVRPSNATRTPAARDGAPTAPHGVSGVAPDRGPWYAA